MEKNKGNRKAQVEKWRGRLLLTRSFCGLRSQLILKVLYFISEVFSSQQKTVKEILTDVSQVRNVTILISNGLEALLGDRDSNPGSMVQSHVSCRWTIPQKQYLSQAKIKRIHLLSRDKN